MNRRTGKPTLIKDLLKEIGMDPCLDYAIKNGQALYLLHFWQLQDPSRCFRVSGEYGAWTVELWTYRVKRKAPLLEKSEDLETAVKMALKRFSGG